MTSPLPIGERGVLRHACLSVCLSVCLSAIISPELHDRSHQLLCMLPVDVARSSSGGVVIRYVFPVLWMTSYLHTGYY